MTHDTTYAKKWRHDRAHGHLRYTPAGPLAAHIRDLLAAGHSRGAIAEAAALSTTAITRIVDGTTRQLQAATAHRLSRITSAGLYDRAHPDGFVPLLGTRRRLQALMALGHDAATIAETVDGLRTPDVYNALNRRGRWITRTQADLIDQAYTALSMRAGTNRHTRGRALAKGWAPPLAWDDDAIDDPTATPVSLEQEQGPAVNVDEVEFLLDQHPWNADQIADRLGVTRSAVEHACARGNRRDLLARMVRNRRAASYGKAVA